MDNFEDVLNQHKEKARKVYAESGEGNLVNSAMREIESNCADYEYYFQMGQQSKQKRIEDLERKLQIKTRHCQFYEQSRKGHRSLAIARKKQINSALEQIEKLYSKAESDYKKECDSYYDGMLSGLDLAEQAIRGELEEQALKGGEV